MLEFKKIKKGWKEKYGDSLNAIQSNVLSAYNAYNNPALQVDKIKHKVISGHMEKAIEEVQKIDIIPVCDRETLIDSTRYVIHNSFVLGNPDYIPDLLEHWAEIGRAKYTKKYDDGYTNPISGIYPLCWFYDESEVN